MASFTNMMLNRFSVLRSIGRMSIGRSIYGSSTRFAAYDTEFEKAKADLNTLKNEPDNATKLQIYAFFKQAINGKCNTKKPGAMDFVGRAKWNAWNSLEDLTQDEAQKQYINIVKELQAKEGTQSEGASEMPSTSGDASKYKFIKYTVDDGISTITLNRPDKFNALLVDTYNEIVDALNESSENDSVVTVITGAGKYYCSGNDLSNFANITPDKIKEKAIEGGEVLRRFVGSFIDFPKPLIAAVNGPAVGVAVTTLGLCDAVYASDTATFSAPLVTLGQSAEGCSSYTYPRIMGTARSNTVLLFGHKMSALQAQEWGLVTEVFPEASFHKELAIRLRQLADLPKNALSLSKQLIRNQEKDILHQVNMKECELLVERWQSDECMNAIMKFMSRKS